MDRPQALVLTYPHLFWTNVGGIQDNVADNMCRSAQDPDPRDPKGVPWDQDFFLKIYVSTYKSDHILCIL